MMSHPGGRPRLAHIDGQHWCTGCMEYLPVEQFARDTSRWDGLYHYCRKCRQYLYHRARRRVQQQRMEPTA